ncbi:MAG: NADPH-dependent FMN reductase, partial [Halohasta sp.]
MATPHVVALVGSLREGSYTRLAAKRALEGVEAAGGSGELLDLRAYDL